MNRTTKSDAAETPHVVPVDDEHARMLAYARSAEGRARIAEADAQIDAGRGIVADDAYFEKLRTRRAERRKSKSRTHA